MATEAANIARTKIVPTETTLTPYYDDFEENKNFHRILFKPGRAVQARELTQSQTIMQNQIERFGNHVFKNGSIVEGAQITFDVYPTLNLKSQYAGSDVFVSDLINKNMSFDPANTELDFGVVTGGEATSNTNPYIMIAPRAIDYDVLANTVIKVVDENTYAQVDSSNFFAEGLAAVINEGIFFFNGYFVKNSKQIIVLDPYSVRANVRVGIEFTEEIVNSDEDTTLLDPAQESSNFQGIGADRLKITLNFTTRSLDSEDDETFVELLRIQNGQRLNQIQYPIYSGLGDQLARRTYDESGDYTVRPFRINVVDHATDDTKLTVRIDPGKAYVKGYEIETLGVYEVDIDRARDFEQINNIEIVANYGNYATVKDMVGLLDYTEMPLVDLHCVPHQSVVASSNSAYQSTKIGTARIRSLEYTGASNTQNASTHTYDMSMFDLNFRNITGAISAAALGNTITTISNTNFTSANNAYAGGTLRFTSGNANGASYLITAYDGVTKTFTLSEEVEGTLANNDSISVESSFAIVESFVSNTSLTPGATEVFKVNISDANRNPAGYTYLFDAGLNSLVYKLPYNYTKEASIVDQQYQYFKPFSTVSFVAGTATIFVNPSRETFVSAGGTGTSSAVLDNFIIVNSATDQTIIVDSVSINTVTGVATLTYGSFTGNAKLFAKVNLNSGPNVNEKVKELNKANTEYFTSTAETAYFVSSELGSNVSIYLDGSQAIVTNPTKLRNKPQSLHVSDVKRITAIYDLNGATLSAGDSLASYTDVKQYFVFDTGQRDTHYDYATISLKPKVPTPSGPLLVCFDWYDHIAGSGDDKGYFSIDSYPDVDTTAGYADVPKFVSSQGNLYNLRDCIDFRPRRKNCESLTINFDLEGIRIPAQGENFDCDMAFYLARNDLLAISKNVFDPFVYLKGRSDLRPTYPRNLDNTMVLYKLRLSPYTETRNEVATDFVENKRYTMRDIGLLEQRIENLEYYTSLSILEKTATDMVIKDPNGLDRTKNGIIVDNFMTHGIGNVNNPDYYIAMDKAFGAAAPVNEFVETKYYVGEKENVFVGKRFTTLSFTEVPAIVQPFATKQLNIMPYERASFMGVILLDPIGDYWVDTKTAPEIIINAFGENDSVQITERTVVSPPPPPAVPPPPPPRPPVTGCYGGSVRWPTHHFGQVAR